MKQYYVILPFCVLLLAGCANPTFTETKTNFVPQNWRTVAILPFAGDVRFSATATDVFSARMLNLNNLKLIQPSETEVVVKRLGVIPNASGFTVLEAQKVATEINADAVIVGVVTSHNNGATLNGFCTARVIDTKSGETVAVSHHPSGLLFGYSEHQAVVAATERTSKEVAKILAELSRKNQVAPKASGSQKSI